MARSTAWLLRLTVATGHVAVSAHAQRLDPVDEAPAASRFVTGVMHEMFTVRTEP
jgi:hypothetical protein